jgi:hypothetical protein
MLRLDGDVFLLGTAMAELLHMVRCQFGFEGAVGRAGQSDGAGKNEARSEPETPAGFKRQFRAVVYRSVFRDLRTAKGFSGFSASLAGGSNATPGARG